MKNIENHDELELIIKAKNGDKEAAEKIVRKYSYIVRHEVRFFYLAGAEPDDLYQEGMIALFTSIYDFNPKAGTSFSTFALNCIKRKIRTAVTASNREKNKPLNDYISLNAEIKESEEDTGLMLLDVIPGSEPLPEKVGLDNEALNELEKKMKQNLSQLEYKTALLYIKGYSRKEIGRELNKSEKSISNTLTRIQNKLSDKS